MTGKRFFAWLWRINALVVFAVGLVSLIVLIFASVALFKDFTREHGTTDVVNIAEDQVQSSTASLGAFDEVAGGDVLRAPLNVHQEYGFGSGSKDASSLRNYLYFNSTTQESYWLIPGYRGLIVDTSEFPSADFVERSEPARIVVYELVDSDSNRDDRLTDEDAKTIAVSDPSGKNFSRVLNDVEEFKGAQIVGDTRLVILYTSGTALHAAEIELASHKVTRNSLLKPTPPEGPL